MYWFLVVLAANAALCSNVEYHFADPAPPNISQQFISNYTLGDPSSNMTFKGYIAVDYKNGGGLFNLNGVIFLPLFIETNFVATPTPEQDTINLYWYYGDICWNVGTMDMDSVDMFPLAIPPGSKYEGIEVIQQQKCSKWTFDSPKFNANVSIWVNVQQDNVVRIELAYYNDVVRWEFFNTVIGPFNSSIYSIPEQNCLSGGQQYISEITSVSFVYKLLFNNL